MLNYENSFVGLPMCKRCVGIAFVEPTPGAVHGYIPPNKIDKLLWLGPEFSASSQARLAELGISHILRIGDDLSVPPLEGMDCLALVIPDDQEARICDLFEQTNAFIASAIAKNEGVLVHCRAGISRSASVVLAYVMKNKKFRLVQALEFVRQNRPGIAPNIGFMHQLEDYENYLLAQHILD